MCCLFSCLLKRDTKQKPNPQEPAPHAPAVEDQQISPNPNHPQGNEPRDEREIHFCNHSFISLQLNVSSREKSEAPFWVENQFSFESGQNPQKIEVYQSKQKLHMKDPTVSFENVVRTLLARPDKKKPSEQNRKLNKRNESLEKSLAHRRSWSLLDLATTVKKFFKQELHKPMKNLFSRLRKEGTTESERNSQPFSHGAASNSQGYAQSEIFKTSFFFNRSFINNNSFCLSANSSNNNSKEDKSVVFIPQNDQDQGRELPRDINPEPNLLELMNQGELQHANIIPGQVFDDQVEPHVQADQLPSRVKSHPSSSRKHDFIGRIVDR